jgi:hypothetical protein
MAPLVCERLHLDDAHRGRPAWGTATSPDSLRWQQALETGGVVVGDEIRISADIGAGTERRVA